MIYRIEDLEPLRPYATPLQEVTIDALLSAGGDDAKAAADLGVETETIRGRMRRLQRHASERGYNPVGPSVPVLEGYAVKGTSTLIREDGSVAARWVKTERDKSDRLEALYEALQGAFKPHAPRAKPPTPRGKRGPRFAGFAMRDLLQVYPLGDPHIGMYSWALETGDDSDLRIAEHNLLSAAEQLVAQSPPAETALIVNLGDFFHSDNLLSRTMRSGHALDTDSRWPKVVHVGLRVMRRLIECALDKHRHVHVINAIGNHDDHTSIFLTIALDQIYEKEPRVTIGRPAGSDRKDPPPPVPFHYFPFGRVLIGVTHGDKTKGADLPGIMAAAVPQMWGESTHRTWLCGHVHHLSRKEYPGVTVETFRTLAARDAYAAQHGYHSMRDMVSILFHREHGEIARHTLNLSRIPPLG